MTTIVGVHGIGNYHFVPEADGSVETATKAISRTWSAALGHEIRVAYYAHLLHRGTAQGADDVEFLDEDAQDLLVDWIDQLAPAGVPQGPRTARARGAADWLVRHMGKQALGAALKFVREVSTYLGSEPRRQQAREAVAGTIAGVFAGNGDRARIVIAHSLGTVVAYETLWQHPELEADLLVTLGSPLAMPSVIFDRLDPEPVDGRGQRPPSVAAWANLADIGDIVAIPRDGLSPHFRGLTSDDPAITIDRNAFHTVDRYLAAPETAAALGPYL
jgi:hypothetical protein